MNDQNNGLVPVRNNLPDAPPQDDYTRRLFGCFREVFAANNQPERAVFWAEESRGKIILRHVRKLGRTRKMEDLIIGRVGNDFGEAKIAIGNYAADSAATTIRWELYANFELTELVASGRFDFADLLEGGFESLPEHRSKLVHDWDFDSIALTHRCPHCNGTFNRTSVLYVPHFKCEHCGKSPTADHARNVINALMRKHKIRAETLSTHPVEKSDDRFKVQYFVDPLPNSVVYWWITTHITESISRENSVFYDHAFETLQALYRASLFRLMQVSQIRSAFEEYLKTIDGEDWELFMGQLAKFGELLEAPFKKRLQESFLGCSHEYVKIAMPHLINRVIMGHVLGPQTETITVM